MKMAIAVKSSVFVHSQLIPVVSLYNKKIMPIIQYPCREVEVEILT